jgi:hypothetical protein
MVYIQNCWLFRLCLTFLKAKNTTFRKLNLLPSSGETKEGDGGVKKPTHLGPLERERERERE